MLEEEAKYSRQKELGLAARRLEKLFRDAIQDGDKPQALAVTRERIKLFGLAEPERQAVDVTSGGQPLRTEIAFSVAPGSSTDA